MKIGILTFHCALNYGAVLQAYALVTYLRKRGDDAEIIDYRPKSLVKSHGIFPYNKFVSKTFKGKIKYLLHILPYLNVRRIRARKMSSFIESLPLSSKKYTEVDKVLHGYDIVICGSDQVWNTDITHGQDLFFTHLIKSEARFVSYAASSEINERTLKDMQEIISRFDVVSVREQALKQALEKNSFRKEIYKVIDPVFLLTPREWRKVAKYPQETAPYLLVYQVRRDHRINMLAKKISEKYSLKIIELTAEADAITNERNVVRTASPQEFLGYFANAKFVLTSSFHGTAFATIFGIPSKTVLFRSPGDGRAMDLIEFLNIKNATIPIDDQDDIVYESQKVDYQRKVEESKKFLNKMLHEKNSDHK